MLRGAEVTLVSGPCSITPPPFVKVVPVVTAKDMFDAVTSVSAEQDIIVKAAAVQTIVLLRSLMRKSRRRMKR